MKPIPAIVVPANVKHSKKTTRWGTPPAIVECARVALGGRIEFDPMSEPRFNAIVGASRFFTKRVNAFSCSWTAETVLINPPGGLVVQAWRRLMLGFDSGEIGRAIWIGFSVEQLCVLADEERHPDDFSKLTLRKRIAFVPHRGRGGSPSHGNYIVGIGIDPALFETAFAGLGRLHHGWLAGARIRKEAA